MGGGIDEAQSLMPGYEYLDVQFLISLGLLGVVIVLWAAANVVGTVWEWYVRRNQRYCTRCGERLYRALAEDGAITFDPLSGQPTQKFFWYRGCPRRTVKGSGGIQGAMAVIERFEHNFLVDDRFSVAGTEKIAAQQAKTGVDKGVTA